VMRVGSSLVLVVVLTLTTVNFFAQEISLTASAGDTVFSSGDSTGSNSSTNVKVNTVKSPTQVLPTPTPTLLPFPGNAGGDLKGSYPDPTVEKFAGRPLSSVAPAVGDILKWNGTVWEPKTSSKASADLTAGAGLSVERVTLSAQNAAAMWNAKQIAGRNIANTAPTTGQVLKWNGTDWVPSPMPQAIPIQTFFQNGSSQKSPEITAVNILNQFILTELSHTIILTKKSRLVISGMINIFGPNCDLCRTAEGYFYCNIIDNLFDVNNPDSQNKGGAGSSFTVNKNTSDSATISNYMVDLNPGNYSVKFKVSLYRKSNSIMVEQKQSSMMIIPLE